MKLSLTLALAGIFAAVPALAQSVKPVIPNQVEALQKSGPITASIPLPDLTHIPILFGKDVKWDANGAGEIPIFGDATKPGMYGILIKWNPGDNSTPHFHSTDRYIYVVSGTWWVNSSTTYDKNKMYPIPAGSFVTDLKNKIHWDGAKAETGPCLLLLVGEGPMVTTRYTPKDASKNKEGQEYVPNPNPALAR